MEAAAEFQMLLLMVYPAPPPQSLSPSIELGRIQRPS